MTNWEWPQYLLAGWWGFWISLGLFIMLSKVEMDTTRFAKSVIDVVVLSLILYAGGFWS